MRRILLAVMISAGAVSAFGQSSIICESINNVRHTCRADVTQGVTLGREMSKNDCVRGKSWGTTRNNDGIWVDNGCRAEFFIGNYTDAQQRVGSGYARTLTCESGGRLQRCPAVTSNGVQLTRQLSKKDCMENKDWGYDNRGIWVKNGCRAEFLLGGPPPMASSAGAIVCESEKGMNHRCDVNTAGGVTLSRQLSGSSCIEGKTWGYDRNGIWVSDGCRAEFSLDRNH